MANNTLGKLERLKHQKQIDILFSKGKSFLQFPIKVMYAWQPIEPNEIGTVKIGVTASKRNFKKAVDRNRIKRLLRESYRTQNAALKEVTINKAIHLHVFFIFIDTAIPNFTTMSEKMKIALTKLCQITTNAAI